MRWVKRNMLVAVAAIAIGALGLVPQGVSADTVTFSTLGQFNGTNPVAYGSPVTLNFGGSSSLKFTGVDNSPLGVDVPGDNPVLIGTLVASSSSNSFDDVPSGTTLSILLTQIAPTPGGTSTFSASVSGTIKKNDNSNNDIEIDWTTATFQIPDPASNLVDTVTYSLTKTSIHLGNGSPDSTGTNPYTAGIYANVSVTPASVITVPLPASALSGTCLLGLLGVSKRLRRNARGG